MNKKRLQRLGVVCMATAMVLTTVSFPRVAKAEGETPTQAEGATSTELEKGKVLVQVDQDVLKANAMCNSEMKSWERIRTKLMVVCGIRVIQILIPQK